MKRILVIALFSVFGSAPAIAQGNPGMQTTPSLPSVEQILGKYIEAIGGRAAFEKLTTRIMHASIEDIASGDQGPAGIYAKAPDKVLVVVSMPEEGPDFVGFNGTVAWERDPQGRLHDLSSGESVRLNRDFGLFREIRLKDFYPQMRVTGKQKVGEHEAYVIEAVPAKGSAEQLYFDTATGLLIRRDAKLEERLGGGLGQYYYEDYRDVDGIKLPFVQRHLIPTGGSILRVTDVQHNVPIADGKFDKPSRPARP